MSQIKLLHSGGNGVIIAAPDSNPASDRTLKLPSDGDGTILTTNSSVGKILQVKSVHKDNGFSVSASSGNFSDITGLSVSITLTGSGSNDVLILFQSSLSTGGDVNQRGSFRLVRGSTVINDAAADGSSTEQAIFPSLAVQQTSQATPVSGCFLDENLSAGTYTYKLQVGAENGAGTIFVNAAGSGNTGQTHYKGVSNIVVMEVAA